MDARQPTSACLAGTRPEKWVDASPHEPTSSVAARSVRARFATVDGCLARCREASESPEAVHQLRVATRRALAVLRVHRKRIPGQELRELKRRLRALRQVAGDARDLDVFRDRPRPELRPREREELLAFLLARRHETNQPLQQLLQDEHAAQELGATRDRVISAIEQGTRPDERPFSRFARRTWRRAVRRFLRTDPGQRQGVKAWHAFRIQGKQLRYTLELLGGALPPKRAARLARWLEKLQDHLGAVNDHFTALQRIAAWRKSHPLELSPWTFEQLARGEQIAMHEALAGFHAWWSRRRRERFRRRAERLARRQPAGR